MTDITKVLNTVLKIQAHCGEIDALEKKCTDRYQNEKKSVEQKSAELVGEMQAKYDAFIKLHFLDLKDRIRELETLLAQDYETEWTQAVPKNNDYRSLSYEANEARLYELIRKINEYIQQLNAVDFDRLVPPAEIRMNGESFTVCDKSGSVLGKYDCNSDTRTQTRDPKPLRDLARKIFPCCKEAELCIDALVNLYGKSFDIGEFQSYVQSSAAARLSETEAELRSTYQKRFDELFRDEKAEAIPESFFTELAREGRASEVDLTHGSSSYRESITIGNAGLEVSGLYQHWRYFRESRFLGKYITNGYLYTPLIIDLKKHGNILLNVNEENYSDETVQFVNQLIIQFLLSFPANRIHFCLIDIDNKMEFSPFKSLTKINNGILMNGIVRDDRQLENTVKDMEQVMYKVKDDILSYNNVEDVYEYNKKYEANPQNFYLMVLVNYPSGMRDDIAKRIAGIVQNGNQAGIFTVIVNNKACPPAQGYKPAECSQFLEKAAKSALVIQKDSNRFFMNFGLPNQFEPMDKISVSSLPSIVEMLKNSAESNRQKVIPLSQMFGDTDAALQSPKGIPSSAEVLDIPIGARGGEIQTLQLKTTGDGSAHAVVIGGTGSGKSNLLHTIIMSACYRYSPEELNLYLIDFKGGVEFKFYEANKVREKQIPHIKLTGLTSDLEDGVAILNNLHGELRSREDEFRKCGVEDIVQYRNLGKKKPRLFVIIDEIQELFEQDDRLGQKAIDILRELFKKGRAFGINILWASQNIPRVQGLRDKVLSQIGNRISLRLNDPDDAADIRIDPKAVRNLNRPEKGLGVINDIRYGNESVEFRVAYAETSENRQKYAQEIIGKWRGITSSSPQEQLFIVGDDTEPSPIAGNTLYTAVPEPQQIVSRSFGSYTLQLGQDYVTGKPYDINIALRENKMNLLLAGYDIEMLRDMMGYALLSVMLNQMTNRDCAAERTRVYYANGEMISPQNADDLFNVIRIDFSSFVENVSSTDKLLNCIKNVYRLYRERSIDSDSSEYAKAYTPCFVVIHSLQRYADLFNENPVLTLKEKEAAAGDAAPGEGGLNSAGSPAAGTGRSAGGGIQKELLDGVFAKFAATPKPSFSSGAEAGRTKMPDMISFSDAVKELLDRGGKFGIHFIVSVDNPLGITALKASIPEMMYKVFVKGVNANVLSQLVGSYKPVSNPQVALVYVLDEYAKVRAYRYDPERDAAWYGRLCDTYKSLLRSSDFPG